MGVPSAIEATPVEALFEPFVFGDGLLPNRIVMAPMTRRFCPDGVPGEDVTAYYARRAEGGVGLIVTEGACVEARGAALEPRVPRLFGRPALAGWAGVVAAVHRAGARIVPQLWHAGPDRASGAGSSARVVADFVHAVRAARELGFDGVQLHAGGRHTLDMLAPAEAPLAVAAVQAIRAEVGRGFPILFRFDRGHLGEAPRADGRLAGLLGRLARAGVDIFDATTERLADPVFAGSAENLAAWTRRVGGRAVIAGGGVGWPVTSAADIAALAAQRRAGAFDLLALGQALLSEPDWPRLVRQGAWERVRRFAAADRLRLVV